MFSGHRTKASPGVIWSETHKNCLRSVVSVSFLLADEEIEAQSDD